AMTANSPATINVEAQDSITSATLKASDAAGNFSISIQNVFLGTTGEDSTLIGTANSDFIYGFGSADTITGKEGADVVSGGAGANTFVFAAGDNGTAPSDTVCDTISDFRTGTNNLIDFGATALAIANQVGAAGAGVATIAATGIVTFNAADTTLAQHIVAVAAAIGAGPATGEFAIWQEGADAYLFISDAAEGVTANDVLVKLTGVTIGAGGVSVAVGDISAIA
ncbi:MAG: hypothetical protein PHU77_15020, partial [Simplicispira sp.]|nr:hypothetical protein [Simplicispira sp.]